MSVMSIVSDDNSTSGDLSLPSSPVVTWKAGCPLTLSISEKSGSCVSLFERRYKIVCTLMHIMPGPSEVLVVKSI